MRGKFVGHARLLRPGGPAGRSGLAAGHSPLGSRPYHCS